MLSLSDPTRFRRRIGGASLVLGPVALAASLALKVVNTDDARGMLDAAAAHHDRLVASNVAQLVAVVLMLPATLAVLHMLRGRGAALGHVAIGLLFLNLIGNAGDVIMGQLLASLSTDGVSARDVTLLASVKDSGVGSVVELLVLFGLLGFPLLAGALWRAGVHRAVPAAIAVSFLSFFVPIPEAIGGALMAVALAWLGVEILAGGDERWRHGFAARDRVERGAAVESPA